MKTIGLVILISLSLCNVGAAQAPAYEKKCTAVVNGETAQFSFPIPQGQTLTWDMNETSDDVMEYSWELCLERSDIQCKYRFGVLHFKFDRSEKKGNIRELISSSQKSVWDASNWVQTEMKIDATIEHDNLIIRITDQKTFAEIFASNPKMARCKVKTPYKDLNYESKTGIKYNK
ncbi:MAG TPA: hypothetical protein VMU21_10595 [Thermodesulfovibrionales bacterium]|nr:hypothetical protein [Thermodesulfovibrionales bacterium]